MRNSSGLHFIADSFETSQVYWSWSEDGMWFGYNPQIRFCYFSRNLNLVFFQVLLLSTYVDSMYLEWINPPINFTFSDDSVFLKENLGGGHKFSEFAC